MRMADMAMVSCIRSRQCTVPGLSDFFKHRLGVGWNVFIVFIDKSGLSGFWAVRTATERLLTTVHIQVKPSSGAKG